MNLKHRCYAGNSQRPTPQVLINTDLQIFAIVTPWGPLEQTKEVLDFLINHYEGLSSDKEKTSIYSKLHSLSEEENALRSLLLFCNEWVFKEQNMERELKFGYELVFGQFKTGKLIFAQIGQPFIYLDREGIPLQSLGHILDLSGLLSKGKKRMPPLPSHLMGIYPDTNFYTFSCPLEKKDQLIFISRDVVPGSLLDIERENRKLKNLTSLLVEENEESPFWIGILSF